MKEKLYIFDTTLRDGAQTYGVDFNVDEKKLLAKKLDELGVDYIEAVSYTHLTLPPIYSV